MKLTKELINLVSKWKKILKLEDWNFDIELECDKKYKKIEKGVGFEVGTTKGMNISTEEQQHSLILLNNSAGSEGIEWYLIHELNHTILNEMFEFVGTLIEMVENEEVKSVLRSRHTDILEKIVWKYTRIVSDLDKKEGRH